MQLTGHITEDEVMALYLGSLPSEEQQRFHRHVADCTGCSREYELYREIFSGVETLVQGMAGTYDEDLLRVTREIHAANKPIACVCHGIEILTAADCIRGRTVTTVAKCALDAQQGGATYVDQQFVVDANIVTARTWHDNTVLMREFLKLLSSAQA